MRTMHPVLKRGALYWDEDLLPRAVYQRRYRAIQAKLLESADDAWLIYGDVERYGNIAYVSNFLPRTRSAAALITRGAPPTLLVNVGERDIPAAKRLTWVEDVLPFSRLAPRVIALLRGRGLESCRLGLVGVKEAIPSSEWTAIQTELPDLVQSDRTNAFEDLRRSKEPCEIEALRRVTTALADAFALVPGNARAGVSLRQLGAQIDRSLRYAGAEDIRILIGGACPDFLSLRPPGDAVLDVGSIVTIYAAAEIQRYWAAKARTFCLGVVPQELRRLGERVADSFDQIRAAALPGVQASELAKIAARRLPSELASSALSFGYGHAVGLDLEERPEISLSERRIVPEGAALVLQVITQSGLAPLALADTLFVGSAGAPEPHSQTPISCPIPILVDRKEIITP